MLFGWIAANPAADTAPVLATMAAALKTGSAQAVRTWNFAGFGIGVLELPTPGDTVRADDAQLVPSLNGESLWMAGEAFDWPSDGGIDHALDSRRDAFRRRLLETLLRNGPSAIADLDGEYQIAMWNPQARRLLLLNDRFAALPMYTAQSAEGVAFAGGVRGVLVAPGISSEPDVDAIREAVSFGGFRLGGRTNVRAVSMAPPSAAITVTSRSVDVRRYWTWNQLSREEQPDARALLEETRGTWRRAVARRLHGSAQPGLTLSGGLDSRAILAEAACEGAPMTALTYGVAASDDVKIARRAARAAGAEWVLFPLYESGWLERRTRRIHETDGLLNLVDLMHLEPLDDMPRLFDTYLSGYLGDAITGSTNAGIRTPADLVASMPYYGTRIGMPYDEAVARAEAILGALSAAAPYAQFEHKYVQATNRITLSARPYVAVRRPFVAYAFFDLAQRIPMSLRAHHAWHERWLVSTYPSLFARIPNQKTAVPVQSSWLRWQLTRTARFGWRRGMEWLRARGADVDVPQRHYHPDDSNWSTAHSRRAIESTILRPGSICCDLFGREIVQATLSDFFDRGAGATQIIGALFVFEHYHQTLTSFLADARVRALVPAC